MKFIDDDSPRRIFANEWQAIDVLWVFMVRLMRLLGWTCIAILHVLLLQLALIAAWASGHGPADLWAAFLAWSQQSTAAVLGLAGVSATTLAAGWMWLMRRLLLVWRNAATAYMLRAPR